MDKESSQAPPMVDAAVAFGRDLRGAGLRAGTDRARGVPRGAGGRGDTPRARRVLGGGDTPRARPRGQED